MISRRKTANGNWKSALKKIQEESCLWLSEGFQRAICVVFEELFGLRPAWVEKPVEEEVFTSHFERMLREALIAPDLNWIFGRQTKDEPE